MFGVGGSARIGIWVLGVLLGITLSPGAQNFGVGVAVAGRGVDHRRARRDPGG